MDPAFLSQWSDVTRIYTRAGTPPKLTRQNNNQKEDAIPTYDLMLTCPCYDRSLSGIGSTWKPSLRSHLTTQGHCSINRHEKQFFTMEKSCTSSLLYT
ncbi:hypothetical protein AVEN_211946-1 [Araneus ventricosus]|uniref:Uncharacterized protein n=1 Tax=Araneus ventricosus TaxID=182803 RepID=A0A4Y2L8N1_ARAVE|nr:hypothetical protein AVEN_211946-1 [Araneus ventricosus]